MSKITPELPAAPPLPMTPEEVAARGWEAVDVVFVSGDAYVDHPSFAMALLGRILTAEGYRVAILSQPDWRSCAPWQTFGRPRVCFAVSAGNMDSMLNHYTASRKVRNDDAYSPDGKIGLRPDRATLAYCQRAREAYKGVPIIVGGVEASLRRLAHYDYWSDKVRRSIIQDCKADLLVYGMGERPLLQICRRLAAGEPVEQIRNVRSTVYRLGASETVPARIVYDGREDAVLAEATAKPAAENATEEPDYLVLPSYEEVVADKQAFLAASRVIHRETNPYNARRLVQYHGREAIVVNAPAWPLPERELDRIFDQPFTRRPHPSYGDRRIPAYEVVKDSIQILRGCFGGCTFCSLTAHQGKVVQNRSRESILNEIRRMTGDPNFSGVVSDLGGPTANMYGMYSDSPEACKKCLRASCVFPTICHHMVTDHGPLLQLMKESREQSGVKKVLVASGIRTDLAARHPEYIAELARHHTGGLLKVAPEHVDPTVLKQMKKPPVEDFLEFEKEFHKAADSVGKELYLVPYFMAGHPGSDLAAMLCLAAFLKKSGYRPDKVQDFIPLPMDPATCTYYTEMDMATGRPVYVAKKAHERRLQRALLQFWKPENYDDVREALETLGRTDLIGDGPECLISRNRPRVPQAGKKRPVSRAGERTAGGYRPHRKTARRRQ